MLNLLKKINPVQALILSFAGIILVGTILLSIPISWEKEKYVSGIDALFTATSAVCVTGLVAVDTPKTFSTFGEVVTLLLIQLGGLGVVTFATFFIMLMGQEVGFFSKLILKESFNVRGPGEAISLVWNVVKITAVFEGVGVLLLTAFWAGEHGVLHSLYLAVYHSVSAFCNAGFSLFSNNLESYMDNWWVNLTIMSLIIFGGLGFPVLVELLLFRKKRQLSIRTKIVLWTTAFLIFGGALLIHLFSLRLSESEYMNLPSSQKLLVCLFQSVTARTAGFNTINLNVFPDSALLVLMALMFIGGSPAGTAGGIKTTTFWVILIGAWNYLRGEEVIRAWGREISLTTFQRAVVLSMIAFMIVSICVGIMSLSGGNRFIALAFEAVSAFGTVGLSLGITPELNSIQKLIIIALMFIGRVGPISFAYFFLMRRKKSTISYPSIEIPIG